MPSYRQLIKNETEFESFLKNSAIPNKVVLFTNKNETSPLFKGLSATFKSRIAVNIIKTINLKYTIY
jgi:hypothetical protein